MPFVLTCRSKPALDTTPPTVPASVVATSNLVGKIPVSWLPSSDSQSGIGGYRIRRDGLLYEERLPASSVSYDDTNKGLGMADGESHTYVVSAFDANGNESSLSAPSSATTAIQGVSSYNPGFPRLGSYAIGGNQNYAVDTVLTALSNRHVNIVTHYPGWQNTKAMPMGDVCAEVKRRSTIGSKMYVYIDYIEISNANANPGNAFWEIYQYASTNNGFGYQNGIAHTTIVSSSFGASFYRLNFTYNMPFVAGKKMGEWYIDWTIAVHFNAKPTSNGSATFTAQANPNWDGMYFDCVLYRERNPDADLNLDGALDQVTTSAASRAYIQESHARLCTYYKSVAPAGQAQLLVNSADWPEHEFHSFGSFSDSPLNQKADGGVLERLMIYEQFNSMNQLMRAAAIQMNAYASPKLGVFQVDITSLSNVSYHRYVLALACFTNTYLYAHAGSGYLTQDLDDTWLDEYDGGGVGLEWLGQPLEPVPNAARYFPETLSGSLTGGGIWRRDFENGIVLVWARRGNGQDVNFDQVSNYPSLTLERDFWNVVGDGDPTWTNGQLVRTLAGQPPRTARFLRKTAP